MKIDVTFSGQDPQRLGDRLERRVRERLADFTATVRLPSSKPDGDADLTATSSSRSARRRTRRDRRS